MNILKHINVDTIHKVYSFRRRDTGLLKKRIIKGMKTNGDIAELDSHADTTCCGKGFQLLQDTGKTVSVEPFLSQYEPVTDIPIGTCITAYDHEETGETYILLFHQALYFGDRLETSLLNPNQMRDNGITVDECPMSLSNSKSTHSIRVNDLAGDLIINLKLNGVFSGFNCRLPSKDEIENCPCFNMTSNREWNSYSNRLSEK